MGGWLAERKLSMGNTIKRNSILLEMMALTDSSAFGGGEIVSCYKNEWNEWISTDSDGKKWSNHIGHLRNENFYKLLNQYSMSDIIYRLMETNSDYQTVAYGLLEEAVTTALKETGYASTLDNVCNYIMENLI